MGPLETGFALERGSRLLRGGREGAREEVDTRAEGEQYFHNVTLLEENSYIFITYYL